MSDRGIAKYPRLTCAWNRHAFPCIRGPLIIACISSTRTSRGGTEAHTGTKHDAQTYWATVG
jgi:hypothetical protein